jgi:hypothetical protein
VAFRNELSMLSKTPLLADKQQDSSDQLRNYTGREDKLRALPRPKVKHYTRLSANRRRHLPTNAQCNAIVRKLHAMQRHVYDQKKKKNNYIEEKS